MPIWATAVVGPSGNAVVGVQLQLPFPSTVPVHSTVPVGEVVTVTKPPGVPVPVKVGVVSLTTLPVEGIEIVGVVLLTLNGREADGPVLPPASVAVACKTCGPLLSGVLTSQLQLPLVSVVAVHSSVPFSLTFTVLFGSDVPVTVGVLSLVVLPEAGVLITGAAGATVSIVKLRTALGAPVVPPTSVAVAVMACAP